MFPTLPNQGPIPQQRPQAQPHQLVGPAPQKAGMLSRLFSPEMLLAWAAMAGGQNFGQSMQGFGMGAAQAMQMRKQQQMQAQDQHKQQMQQNKTLAFLEREAPEYADAVRAGVIDAGQAWRDVLKAKQGGSQPSYSKSPIYGTDADGNTLLGTIGDDGSFRQIDTGGFTPSNGVSKLDLGDRFAIQNKRTGEIIGYEDKNLANAERQKAIGKEQGADANLLSEMESRMGGLENVVSQLDELAETATYTYAGQASDFARTQMGLDPSEGAIARTKYDAIVSNQILPLLKQTFGAAFTVKEGESLRATLGDANKSPQEKQAVLQAFIQQKRRDIEAQRVQAGISPQVAPPQAPAGDIQSLIDQYAD